MALAEPVSPTVAATIAGAVSQTSVAQVMAFLQTLDAVATESPEAVAAYIERYGSWDPADFKAKYLGFELHYSEFVMGVVNGGDFTSIDALPYEIRRSIDWEAMALHQFDYADAETNGHYFNDNAQATPDHFTAELHSSFLDKVSWQNGVLTVDFQNGTAVRYEADIETARALAEADSAGEYWHAVVKHLPKVGHDPF